MPTDAFTFTSTLPPSTAPQYAVGNKVDVVVDSISIAWCPKDLFQKNSEVLMTATLTSGDNSKSWSSLVKNFRGGQTAFDATKTPCIVAHGLELSTTGVGLTLELREVDDLSILKQVLEKLSGADPLLKIIPVVGPAAAAVADVGKDVAGALPDSVGRTFFTDTIMFGVNGGLNPHSLPTVRQGKVSVTSSPKPAFKFGGSTFCVNFL